MNIFNYHPITKEFLNAGLADPNPLEPDNWLIPANATIAPPPAVLVNQVAVFEDDAWQIKPDYRNVLYYMPDGKSVNINQIGIEPDLNWHLEPVPKSLIELKAEKLSEIRTAYSAAVIAPVEALGHTWDGGFESAIKLDAAMRLSQAAGGEGVIFYDVSNIGHALNFADALQVCIAVASAYQRVLSQKQSLFSAVQNAENLPELDLIIW